MKPGTVLGHEGVGIVEEVGKGVRNLKRGDRVVIPSTVGCGNCSYCRTGYSAQCDDANPQGPTAGTVFFGGPEAAGGLDGLQAEYARVPFAYHNLVKLPDHVTDDQAILMSDIYPTAFYGAVLAEVKEGDVVAVWGCGPVGLFAVLSAFQMGAHRVIAIDGPTVTNLTIQNCNSTDATAKAATNWLTVKVQAGKTASGIRVQNNTVQAKRMGCEIFNHDNFGVYAGRDIVVKDNNFYDSQFGISLSGPLDGVTVDNNYLKNCRLYGIEIAGAARTVKLTNNKFEGNFDKFIEGSNDGSGEGKNGGSIVGGMVITNNITIGTCTGGIQLFNAGAAQFTNNRFRMTGRLELISKSSSGGTYTGNELETTLDHAVMCDNASNNTFSENTISNRNCPANDAVIRAYYSGAVNNTVQNTVLIKGVGGTYYKVGEGATIKALANKDEAGNPIP